MHHAGHHWGMWSMTPWPSARSRRRVAVQLWLMVSIWGFPKSQGYPKLDGLLHGKSHLYMDDLEAAPDSGNLQMFIFIPGADWPQDKMERTFTKLKDIGWVWVQLPSKIRISSWCSFRNMWWTEKCWPELIKAPCILKTGLRLLEPQMCSATLSWPSGLWWLWWTCRAHFVWYPLTEAAANAATAAAFGLQQRKNPMSMWMTRFLNRQRTFQGPSCFDFDNCRTLYSHPWSRWPSMAEMAARYQLSDLVCLTYWSSSIGIHVLHYIRHIYIYIYDMIWYDMMWCDVIWYDMIWYDMIWYDMIWYEMISRYISIQTDPRQPALVSDVGLGPPVGLLHLEPPATQPLRHGESDHGDMMMTVRWWWNDGEMMGKH